jgi:hypothetical protein
MRAKLKPKRRNHLQRQPRNTPRQNPINPERQTLLPEHHARDPRNTSASGKNRCRQLEMLNVRACRSGQCLTPKFVCNETGGLSSTPDYFVEIGPRIVLG